MYIFIRQKHKINIFHRPKFKLSDSRWLYFIICHQDLQTLDLEPYKYCGVNLTGLRLIDPESPFVRNILQSRSLNWNLTEVSHLRVEPALAYDAIQLFASGYARLRDSVNGNLKRLFCNRTETWGHGFSLINYMRSVCATIIYTRVFR